MLGGSVEMIGASDADLTMLGMGGAVGMIAWASASTEIIILLTMENVDSAWRNRMKLPPSLNAYPG